MKRGYVEVLNPPKPKYERRIPPPRGYPTPLTRLIKKLLKRAKRKQRLPKSKMMPQPPIPPTDLRAFLASFAENLTAKATAGGQPGVYNRETEVNQILQALASPLKGRVVIVGKPRAGKTAVAQTVAAKIASGECPPELAGKEVWRFTPNSLPGLSSRHTWQVAFDQFMTLWAATPDVILFIDQINRAMRLPGVQDEDGEGGVDVAMVLASALKRMNTFCLAEAEENAWRRFSETYSDYGQLFLPVRVEELDLHSARKVIRKVADDLSILHGLTVADEALEQALDLSYRYALDRAQPGKTIDLLRDSLAVTKADGDAQLTAEHVIERFGEQSGLPRILLDDAVPFNEDEVLRFFKSRVLAQDQAVEAIVQSLSLLRARVNNPSRPMGVFLFLGPTGVGKTELARTLAEYLYGERERLVRFNMADYANPYQHTELFGNPYAEQIQHRRGQLTNRLAGKMFSVLVLDEFEKAHPFIYQRFLQLFDEGLLINGNDEIVNLRNSIFILTSNFGAQLLYQPRLGFKRDETAEARETRILSETEQYFTPEFMNRIDAVCIFHPLNRAVMADIARREIGDLLLREGLTRRKFEADIADEVIEHVVALGYSPYYGARYLKRQIEKTITYPLAREINALSSTQAGGAIRLYLRHGRIFSAYLPPTTESMGMPPTTKETASTGPTLSEVRDALPILSARVEALEELHGLDQARAEREAILAEMADVSFWNDHAAARRKLDAYQRASSTVDLLSSLRGALDKLSEASAAVNPPLDSIQRWYKFLNSELPRIEFTSWLSGPHDTNGAYLQIGIKSKVAAARQWVASLAKMYLGWAKLRGLSASVLGEDHSPDGRSLAITLVISGFGVYGLLQGEGGTHRLVQTVKVGGQESLQRLSAAVSVFPELSDDELPSPAPRVEVTVKDVKQSGLLLPRLTTQVSARHTNGDRRLNLASNLPPEDLSAEATRILQTSLYLESGQNDTRPAPPPGGIVRSYIRSTKDKGVHDHRTGRRSLKLKQVLDGDIQEFLDEALKERSESN
jgi:ATP-dependent Clp protease ATP-binding subunit ClpA/protein subunit release factor A